MKTTNKNSASTLLAVLALLVILSACMYGALNYTATVSFNVMGTNTLRRATEVGDGTMDYMFAYWRELMKEQPSTYPPTSTFASIPLPTQAMFPAIPNFTVSRGANPATGTPYTIANYMVQAVTPQIGLTGVTMSSPGTSTLSSSTNPTQSFGMSPDVNTTNYYASCDVSLPAFAGRNITVRLRRIFQKQITSPWQFALFYNDLLEINPGAPMTIAGWVHTNNNLYTAGNGSGTQELTFQNMVDYSNDWAYNPITFAPGDTDHSTVATSQPAYPSNLPPARGQMQLPFGMDPTQIFTATDPNNLSYRELILPPVAGYPDPIAGQRYYDQPNTDIQIMVNGSGQITMTDNAGNTLTNSFINGSHSTATATEIALYNTFSGAVTVETNAFQDNREAATMNMVNLDVSQITNALTPTASGGTGYLLANNVVFHGLVYIANSAGSATTKWGVRLKNGAVLKGPLTVASENPVYIQGDFNTGQTSGHTTPANSANNNTGNNVVSGYTEQPAAVLGDAVNILSNAWSDSNSSYSSRNATPTTINAAIVSGIVPTSSAYSGANSYSGGAENFPRFLENWSGSTFTYYGSMVELFSSEQATQPWGSPNVYSPPQRQWYFDTNLLSASPPGGLTITKYEKQRWFLR